MEPLELVVLFADADAERFVSKLIERGIERGCLRRLRWRAVRDPMHDARVAGAPTAALRPFLGEPSCRFAFLWDHHGSGQEALSGERAERDVVDALHRAGVSNDRVVAIVLEPELETALVPVWGRVIGELAKKRGELSIAIPVDTGDPKASFAEILRLYRLKASPALFSELAGALSLQGLKEGRALGRLSAQLVEWFGAAES